jgi:hypothetical protein
MPGTLMLAPTASTSGPRRWTTSSPLIRSHDTQLNARTAASIASSRRDTTSADVTRSPA